MRSLYIYLGLCSSQICEKKDDYNKQIKQKGRKKQKTINRNNL